MSGVNQVVEGRRTEVRANQELHDAIEKAAAHIGLAFNDLHFATLAVDLPAGQLRHRMALAVAELNQATRHLSANGAALRARR